jgi:hypothetical protein
MTEAGHKTLHLRTARVCATPGCEEKPEAKEKLCLKCQLEGKPDPPRRKNERK